MKINILIPLYNKEKYIEKCLSSILSQTYKNFEVIILDDGSTDESYNLAKKYTNDPRFKIIKQENVGLGETRNRLVQMSNLPFLLHVDSDDYLEPNCLEILVLKQKQNDSDMVFSDFYVIQNGKKIKNIKRKKFNGTKKYKKYYLSALGYNSVCNILIKRNLYKDIFVPNINYGEDWSVIYKLVFNSKRLNHTRQNTYAYVHNTSGMTFSELSESTISKNIEDVLVIKQNYKEFLINNNLLYSSNIEKNSFNLEVINSIFSILLRNNKSFKFIEKNNFILPKIKFISLLKMDNLFIYRIERMIIYMIKRMMIMFKGY